MKKIALGEVLIEQKKRIGVPTGNDLPLIGVSNKDGLILSKASRLDDLSKYKILDLNWFAYNPMRINVGSIGFSNSPIRTGIISPDYVVFSCSEKILAEYFQYFIKSDLGLLEISRNTEGSVRERLYFRNLAKIEINLPSIEEQIEIISSLNIQNKAITESLLEFELLFNDASKLREGILKLAVKGKLTKSWRKKNPRVIPASILLQKIMLQKERLVKENKIKKSKPIKTISESEIPFELPTSWSWCHLGEVCSVQTGRKDANFGTDKGIYNFYTCAQSPIKSSSYSFEGESILLPGNGANVGLVTYVNEKFEAYQRTYVLNNFYEVYPLYVKTALKALWKGNLGKQYGSAINYIKLGNITEFKIPIPPLEEQKAIFQKVNVLMGLCDELEKEVIQSQEQSEKLMQSVLREVFEGKREEVEI